LTVGDSVYRMSTNLRHAKPIGSGRGIDMYMNAIASFMIILVLVLSRGSRPRPIGA
jgi:hypothetical protein